MQALDRLLALVCRELGASRAWIEYGSAPPPGVLSAPIRDGWRLCATVEDATAELELRLQGLVSGFDEVLTPAIADAPTPPEHLEAQATLQHALDVLVERCAAVAAWVIDERSPVVWGTSSGGEWLDDVNRARSVGAAIGDHAPAQVVAWMNGQQLPPPPAALAPNLATLAEAAGGTTIERLVITWAAVAEASDQPTPWTWDRPPFSVMVRPIAGIYRVLVLFEGEFSPLHAETTLARALPVLERMVTDHPPIDPTPAGARVHMLIPRDRS